MYFQYCTVTDRVASGIVCSLARGPYLPASHLHSPSHKGNHIYNVNYSNKHFALLTGLRNFTASQISSQQTRLRRRTTTLLKYSAHPAARSTTIGLVSVAMYVNPIFSSCIVSRMRTFYHEAASRTLCYDFQALLATFPTIRPQKPLILPRPTGRQRNLRLTRLSPLRLALQKLQAGALCQREGRPLCI